MYVKRSWFHDAAVQVWGMVLWYNVHNKKRAERRLQVLCNNNMLCGTKNKKQTYIIYLFIFAVGLNDFSVPSNDFAVGSNDFPATSESARSGWDVWIDR